MARTRILLAAWLGLLVLTLLLPAGAAAHASLERSTPEAESTVVDAPAEVELTFSGSVVAGSGSIVVFAPDEQDVAVGDPTPRKGTTITQRVEIEQPGTYGVSYRVSSEDGHVITGAFTFVVGAPSDGGGAADRALDAAAVDGSLQAAFSTVRFVEIAALLLAAGSGIFASLLAPGWRPRLLVSLLLIVLASYAAGYVVNTAIIGGTSVTEALSPDALGSTADTPFGMSMQLRAMVVGVALLPALLLRYGPPLPVAARWAVALVFAGTAASLSITGHAVTTEPTWLRMPLDMVHVAAAAVWIGGLVQLGFMGPFATAHVAAIARFSRTAGASVAVILLTGIYATYAELGLSVQQLVDSRYGRLILGKLILYAGTMPLAWNNMSAFVPQLRRRPEDAPQMLRQYVWREFALVIVVVALTVWLIATPQPN